MKCFQRLFNLCLVVPAVYLIQVNVLGPKTAKRGIDGGHDVLARQPALIWFVSHGEENFRRDHNLIPWNKITNCTPEDLLTEAGRVHVSRIKEVNACLQRALKKRTTCLFVKHPISL